MFEADLLKLTTPGVSRSLRNPPMFYFPKGSQAGFQFLDFFVRLTIYIQLHPATKSVSWSGHNVSLMWASLISHHGPMQLEVSLRKNDYNTSTESPQILPYIGVSTAIAGSILATQCEELRHPSFKWCQYCSCSFVERPPLVVAAVLPLLLPGALWIDSRPRWCWKAETWILGLYAPCISYTVYMCIYICFSVCQCVYIQLCMYIYISLYIKTYAFRMCRHPVSKLNGRTCSHAQAGLFVLLS